MLELKDITKSYFIGKPNELKVLKGISMQVQDGEFLAVVGASGSGKSTIMNILGALDRPTAGEYFLDGTPVAAKNDNELSAIRNKKIGFVFQTFNLVPRTTALSNVELPMFYAGFSKSKRRNRAKELLEMFEIGDRAKHMPNELSGGQKQRVAIARSLANDPSIILADEPTGALDTKTGNLVMDLFLKINKQEKKTIILITHNHELAQMTQRTITVSDGLIVNEWNNPNY